MPPPPIPARLALLQVLTLGPGHGAQLARRVKDLSHGSMKLQKTSLHLALTQMRKDLVVSVIQGYAAGRPRFVYALTQKGRDELAASRDIIKKLFEGEALK